MSRTLDGLASRSDVVESAGLEMQLYIVDGWPGQEVVSRRAEA